MKVRVKSKMCPGKRKRQCLRQAEGPLIHLQADDVSVTVGDFLHDAFLPVLPVEGPGWTVAVQLSRGVLVTQHVVAHDREHGCRRGRTGEETLCKEQSFERG